MANETPTDIPLVDLIIMRSLNALSQHAEFDETIIQGLRDLAVSGRLSDASVVEEALATSSPSEKHGWRVLGGMMGPVQ